MIVELSTIIRSRNRLLGLRFSSPKAGSSPTVLSSKTADLPFLKVRL